MAKRSDFAQKLLDDLRLRKERMAVSQSSKGSKSAVPDVYAYSKQTYRGAGEMKTYKSNGIRSESMRSRSSAGKESPYVGEASTDMVPFRRDRSSEQFDLSMALAFALENGGKLRRMDSPGNSSMLDFLHQVGRRQVNVGKMERSGIVRHHSSNNSFPTLSHLHIKEISKGAQKLNQILRACSNGLNFDTYSVEIGKELLKGAMDLEESLRMLVNLQEASEYMTSAKSKTRITLLDEDEDNDDGTGITAEHNQLARPRFSFDKPSRNSHYIQEVAMNDLRQRLMALNYTSESTNFNNDKHTVTNSVSYRRSTYGSNEKTSATFSEQKNQFSSSKSRPEKARISNVIAKLMGLEELPENQDSKNAKKESSFKQKTEGIVAKKSAENSMREHKRRDPENSVPAIRKQRQKLPDQIKVTQDTKCFEEAENNLSNHYSSLEMTVRERNLSTIELDGIKPERGTNKANVKMDRNQSNIFQMNHSTGRRKSVQDKERKQDNPVREKQGKEQGEARELIRKNEVQKMAPRRQNGSEAAIVLHLQQEHNTGMLKPEKRDNRDLSHDQLKSSNDLRSQQPRTSQNLEQEDIKHNTGESKRQIAKQKIQERGHNGSEIMSKSLLKPKNDVLHFQRRHSQANQATPNDRSLKESVDVMLSKGFPTKRLHEDLVEKRSYDNYRSNMHDSVNRNSKQNSSPVDLKHDLMEKTSNPPSTEEKPAHPQVTEKRNTKVQKAETLRNIDELVTRKSGDTHSFTRLPKHQASVVQERKQKRRDRLGGSRMEPVKTIRSREAEARIVKSSKSTRSIQQSELNSKVEQASDTYGPVEDESHNLKGPQDRDPNGNYRNKISTLANDEQGQKLDLAEDQPQSHDNVLGSPNGIHESSSDTAYSSQLENQKASKLETPEPLTESENHLKQILTKSQLFLDTAEALFRLNIPFGILHDGNQDYHDQESKFILDCGYELMKRKGKKQELCHHPFMKTSIASVKVKSLDDLIKQLHKDFDKLRYYGRNGDAECPIERYLPKMLECDVYSWDLDVNCMWDFVWDKRMFALLEKHEVIKDVERFLLNGLLDAVTRDLLPVF